MSNGWMLRTFAGWPRRVVTWGLVGWLIIFPLKTYLHFATYAVLSPQSKAMLDRSATWGAALYPDVWPPGYPLLLWGARQLYLPLWWVNLGLFYITLVLLGSIARQSWPQRSPLWLPFFYSLFAFNYYNLTQYTAEALVIPLSLLVLLLLARYLQQRSWWILCLLACCCATLFFARYHTLLWLTPLLLFHLVAATYRRPQTLLYHCATFGLIAFGPITLALWRNYRVTGYLTGMERFDWSTRTLPPGLEAWPQLTGLAATLFLTAKSSFLDLVSPFTVATHRANQSAYPISLLEIGVLILAMLALATLLQTLFAYRRRAPTLLALLRTAQQRIPLVCLAIEFYGVYMLVTIVLWVVGNNDPIYTRFLYPAYPYLMISLMAGDWLIATYRTTWLPPAIWRWWLLTLALIQLYKVAW